MEEKDDNQNNNPEPRKPQNDFGETPPATQGSEQTTTSETEDLNFENRIDLSELQKGIGLIKTEISKVIVGQKGMIDMLIASILANGHFFD